MALTVNRKELGLAIVFVIEVQITPFRVKEITAISYRPTVSSF